MLTAHYGEPPAIIQHVASNGIWDPNKLYNPPVITTTTTGTSIGDYPTHWYDPYGIPINTPVQPFELIPQPLPVVTIPNVTMPSLSFPEILKLIEALQAGAANTKPEEKKVEEPEEEAKPVEKKFVRVLEP